MTTIPDISSGSVSIFSEPVFRFIVLFVFSSAYSFFVYVSGISCVPGFKSTFRVMFFR